MDEPEEASPKRPRWVLPAILTPIGILVVANYVASVIWSTLIVRHPAVLLMLSGTMRWQILVSPRVGALTFYVLGFIRLAIPDPFFYALGVLYGDAALRWTEKKMGDGAKIFLWMEKAFEKARYPMVFVAPNNTICLLAGATRMPVAIFAVLNAAGTIARLYLIRLLGSALSTPIDAVTHFLDHYRWPILGVSLAAFAIQALVRDRSGKKGELAELGELRREVES